jgi:ubiquinone/menaquinone biosynthesis C-methylase UbiE
MNDDATSFIGDIAREYDQGLGPNIFTDYAKEIARRAVASNPARVLETAAGTGIVTRVLRDLLPANARLTASDLNPPMLEIARTKFRSGERVEFQPADAVSLPFPDAAYDAIVCQFGLMFFPDKDMAHREAYRVLAPGGHYVFNVWDSHQHNPFARIANDVVGRFFPNDPPQFYKVPFSCHEIEPIKESLTGAGFSGVEAAVVKLEKEIADTPRFARGLVYGNPLIDQIRSRGGVDPDEVVGAMERAISREFGSAPGRMPLQAIFFSATKS